MDNSIISVENVSKVAGDRQLLSDVSFTIAPQSLVSLIGPNGAGKSTLIKIILGLDSSYTGKVLVTDTDRIQYIPQQETSDRYQLPLSVYEYLTVGQTPLYCRHNKQHDLQDALKHVGVAPEKLTQSVSSLSGGERQRIAIARALLSDPKVLILDEPLAAVDYASRTGLYELIRHLQQDHQMTVLLVSHDIESVLPISDQVLCLNETLRTDCHPAEFTNIDIDKATSQSMMHHHCTPVHPLPSLQE